MNDRHLSGNAYPTGTTDEFGHPSSGYPGSYASYDPHAASGAAGAHDGGTENYAAPYAGHGQGSYQDPYGAAGYGQDPYGQAAAYDSGQYDTTSWDSTPAHGTPAYHATPSADWDSGSYPTVSGPDTGEQAAYGSDPGGLGTGDAWAAEPQAAAGWSGGPATAGEWETAGWDTGGWDARAWDTGQQPTTEWDSGAYPLAPTATATIPAQSGPTDWERTDWTSADDDHTGQHHTGEHHTGEHHGGEHHAGRHHPDYGHAEFGHTDYGHTDAGHTDAGHGDPGYDEPGYDDAGYGDPGHTEAGHTEAPAPETAEPGMAEWDVADDAPVAGAFPAGPESADEADAAERDGHARWDAAEDSPAGPHPSGGAPVRRGGRRRPKPRRSALLTVAAPSLCVLGVTAVAASAVMQPDGSTQSEDDVPLASSEDGAEVTALAANQQFDTQLESLTAAADDYADRASRTQGRMDLAEKKAEEKRKAEEEAARKEAERQKFFLPVDHRGLSAVYGQAGVNWMSLHTGIDFPVRYGTPVRAATDGTIRTQWHVSYGNLMIITAPDGTETWYAHLSSTVYQSGYVQAGTVVAYTGNSGNSMGPHLHFEVRPGGGSAVDPAAWLRDKGLSPT